MEKKKILYDLPQLWLQEFRKMPQIQQTKCSMQCTKWFSITPNLMTSSVFGIIWSRHKIDPIAVWFMRLSINSILICTTLIKTHLTNTTPHRTARACQPTITEGRCIQLWEFSIGYPPANTPHQIEAFDTFVKQESIISRWLLFARLEKGQYISPALSVHDVWAESFHFIVMDFFSSSNKHFITFNLHRNLFVVDWRGSSFWLRIKTLMIDRHQPTNPSKAVH